MIYYSQILYKNNNYTLSLRNSIYSCHKKFCTYQNSFLLKPCIYGFHQTYKLECSLLEIIVSRVYIFYAIDTIIIISTITIISTVAMLILPTDLYNYMNAYNKRNLVKNHRLTPFQWGFLLAIYIFCYIAYVGIDLTTDGIIDMNGHGFFIILIIMASVSTLWYGLSRQAHLYTR